MNSEGHGVEANQDVRGILGCRTMLLLLPAALLLALSLWMMPQSLCTDGIGSRTWVAFEPLYAIRQGIAGVVAMLLALGLWRWLPVRRALRLGWVPLALFGVAAVAAPLSLWAGWGFLVKGTYWWQRSPGLVIVYLAMLGGLSMALPRHAQGARRGWPAFLGVLTFAVIVPLAVLRRLPELFVLFGTAGVCLLFTATGRRLWAGLGVMSAMTFATAFGLLLPRPTMIERCYYPAGDATHPLRQALFAVHCGGLTGDRYHLAGIPEAHSDFVFASLCGKGGLALGIPVFALVGTLLVMAWRVAERQRELEARAWASGCAALLTLRSVFHVAVNLGLWPTMSVALPFLSYGPLLLVFDGGLIGVLLALDRERGTDESAPPPRWPKRVVLAGVGVLLLLFLWRMCRLVYASPSVAEKRKTHVQRMENREREKCLRGSIFDVNGRVLARTDEAKTVFVDPKFAAERGEQHRYAEVARLLGLDQQALADTLSRTNHRYRVLMKDVSEETVGTLKQLSLKSLGIQTEVLRRYPEAAPLAHVAGAVNCEGEGICGLEQAYHSHLVAGHEVRMTIDMAAQASVQAIAETALREAGAREIQIIAMNPRTGAIQAAVQIPATHANNSHAADPRALTWRSLIDVFEPGGVIQPLVIASALDAGVVGTDTPIDCEGGAWSYEGIPLRDPDPAAEMTVQEILVRAGNIGMAKIGLLLGNEALYDALLRWGVSQPLEVGRGMGGGSGVLAQPSRWSSVDITRIPIGHGLALSLLQVCRAYTDFFNEGTPVEPRLVEAPPAVATERADATFGITPETAAQVRSMLVRVVDRKQGQEKSVAHDRLDCLSLLFVRRIHSTWTFLTGSQRVFIPWWRLRTRLSVFSDSFPLLMIDKLSEEGCG